jgi:hypothetical protein
MGLRKLRSGGSYIGRAIHPEGSSKRESPVKRFFAFLVREEATPAAMTGCFSGETGVPGDTPSLQADQGILMAHLDPMDESESAFLQEHGSNPLAPGLSKEVYRIRSSQVPPDGTHKEAEQNLSRFRGKFARMIPAIPQGDRLLK